MPNQSSARILIIDDNRDIHEDFRKILEGVQSDAELDTQEALLFGEQPNKKNQDELPNFKIDFASQGKEGLALVQKAQKEEQPYALVFVDIRMPPGWDGIETIDHIWQNDADIQTVICTAYSDHSWDDITKRLHISDRLLILKKPFDVIEIRQLACALTKKWLLKLIVQQQINELEKVVQERTTLLKESMVLVEEKQRINTMKDEFLITINHELKTPLTAMQGSLDMLVGGVTGAINGDALALLEIARNNGKRLIRLINDILDIKNMESGNLKFQFSLVDISSLVQECIATAKLNSKSLEVSIKLLEDLSNVKVNVDPGRTLQALNNILSNAVKFSPRGGEVTIAITKQDKMVTVAITDNGPGISDEFKSKIFQKFSREDSSVTRQRGGTGLGLSISKMISERLNGAIRFTTSSKGTTFYFDLPIADA